MIIFILYAVAGYWAAGRTVYASKIRFGTWSELFGQRLAVGLLFGWLLFPVALIRVIFGI